MSIVSKAQLKNEFADGQIITESTMDNLIDSTYNPTLVAGTNITLVPSGNDITINSTGGGGGGGIYGGSGVVPAATNATLTALGGISFESPSTGNVVFGLSDTGVAVAFSLGDGASAFDETTVTIGRDSATAAGDAVAIGYGAEALDTGGIAIGRAASADFSTGSIAIGSSSNAHNTNNIAIGTNASALEPGNISIGTDAGFNQIAGSIQNTFIGNGAGAAVTDGTYNTIIGWHAGVSLIDGSSNTLVGTDAGASLDGGENSNTMVGHLAGSLTDGGNTNTFIGTNSGLNNATGGNNVCVGNYAGHNFTDGNDNVCIGPESLFDVISTSSANIAIGHGAGPTVASGGSSAQNSTISIGEDAGHYSYIGPVDNTVDNSIYIGSYATVPTDGQSQLSRFVLGGGRDGGVNSASKLLMYGGFEDVSEAGPDDARLKINPGTGVGILGLGDTATYPVATLQVHSVDGVVFNAFQIDQDTAGANTFFSITPTGQVTIGDQSGGSDYTLPNVDGAADTVLVTDGAGSVGFRPILQHLNGAAPNVGDEGFAMPQVHFSDVLASQTSNAGLWIVPFDITITQIQIKWAGDIVPGIGGGDDLYWDIGTLTNSADTADTSQGTNNFTSSTGTAPSGDGLPAIAVTTADSASFFYKTWTGSIDFTGGDIMIMYYAQQNNDWSETAKDVQVVVTYFQRH